VQALALVRLTGVVLPSEELALASGSGLVKLLILILSNLVGVLLPSKEEPEFG
jgi:hypothetical protein